MRGSTSSMPQPPPMLMLAPPSYVPQYPQGQQPPQMQTQMQNQMQNQTQTQYQHYQIPQPQPQQAPVAPIAPVVGTPISSSAQVYFTSYASQLRTGATFLVQPTLFPGSTTTTASFSLPIPSTSSSSTLGTTTHPTRASRRSRGTVINYAEVDDEGDDDDDGEGEGDDAKKDGDHIPDAGALDDDVTDGDFVAGNGSGRRVGRPSKQQQQVRVDTSMDLDQSYLGQVPPARFIKSRGFVLNAATAQGGPMFALDYGPNYLSFLPSTSPTHPNPILIPVRLESDVPELGLQIRDVFLWNLHEPSSSGITPEVFAAQFCRDLDIGVDPYGEIMARQIRVQVEDTRGEAWVGWMDSLPMLVEDDDDSDEDLNQHQNTECRVILSLNVQISTHHLTDHIEWDLLSPLTPEAFSLQLCADLGLSGEAIPLITHAIHEELCRR